MGGQKYQDQVGFVFLFSVTKFFCQTFPQDESFKEG
ncbi:hypothetical protein SCARR_04161 [Pontiella sulfatireligans]|uniref:Uncharacterized protein n=1 Tax=Pontiella sulfatireligans TaxID=2750658 RepID=A0A6C2UP53_9BACT|nr:hypothetical protein SCARR_04161 [Pontiella sulfatireligans]